MSPELAVSADRQTESLRKPFLMTHCARPDDVRLIFGGHSHCHAICRALISATDAGETADPRAASLAHGLAGLMGVGQGVDLRALMVALAQHRDIALVWRGNQHNGDFLLMPGQVMDLLPRNYPDRSVLPGAQIVPELAIRAQFQNWADELGGMLRDLGRVPGRQHVVVGTPPPLGDDDLVRRRLAREPAFGDRATALGFDLATIGIAPPSVRRKLWFVVQELMAETAAAHGALFVPSPEAAQGADGLLRVEMSGGDVSHANERYGRLVIGDLAGQLAPQLAQA